jgi:hypothetical protein
MSLVLGQGSGDFAETSGRVHLFHLGIRNSIGILTADAFTQANPPIVTTAANVSTTLSGITSTGVLGASVAFTRPDSGNGHHGGPVQVTAAYVAAQKPLGLFINDAIGNAYENTPGVASNRGPYVSGQAVVGVTLWETQQQIGGSAALTYAAGDFLYASVNGLLTNRIEDAYQYNVSGQNDPDFVTVMGVCRVAPDADNSLMVLDLRV